MKKRMVFNIFVDFLAVFTLCVVAFVLGFALASLFTTTKDVLIVLAGVVLFPLVVFWAVYRVQDLLY